MKNDLSIKEKLELAEQEYVNSFISIRDISKKYEVCRHMLSGWLLAKNYDVYNRRASKSFNTNYFDSIDTEEKAYWLGFLFADGAITKNNTSYNIELSLKIDDKEHVEKFAKAIGKSYINNNSTYRSRCTIGSKHMFEILNKYGCTTKKSLTLKFPNIEIFKDKELIRHFIRGYVDGDGCLSYSDKQHKHPYVTILGTIDFLNGIQNIYKSNHKYSDISSKNNITKMLQYSGKTAFKFATWLYKDATIYLERKHLKYLEYCLVYQE